PTLPARLFTLSTICLKRALRNCSALENFPMPEEEAPDFVRKISRFPSAIRSTLPLSWSRLSSRCDGTIERNAAKPMARSANKEARRIRLSTARAIPKNTDAIIKDRRISGKFSLRKLQKLFIFLIQAEQDGQKPVKD